MKAEFRRPAATFVILAASFSAIYCGTWKFDPARLDPRAAGGEAEAQYRLGKMYFDGFLLEKNNEQAAMWLRKAAEQGHAKAQAGIAVMYLNGLGVRRNNAQAAKWYQKAADQNLAVAQNQLGILYAQGKGVQRNFDTAIEYFRKATAQGYKTSKLNLTLALAARASAETSRYLTANGMVYPGARVEKVESDGLTLAFDPKHGGFGVVKLKFADLPRKLQEEYEFTPESIGREWGFSELACVVIQPL